MHTFSVDDLNACVEEIAGRRMVPAEAPVDHLPSAGCLPGKHRLPAGWPPQVTTASLCVTRLFSPGASAAVAKQLDVGREWVRRWGAKARSTAARAMGPRARS